MIKTGQKIQIARVMMGLKQKELAKKLNVRPTTVSAWECGKSEPQPRLWLLFQTLCDLNGISFTPSGMPIAKIVSLTKERTV